MINPLPGMPLIESPLLGAMKPSLAMLHHLLVDHAAGRVGETTVVTDGHDDALYFFKHILPFGAGTVADVPVLLHLGLYTYRPAALAAYRAAAPSHADRAEGLEQLRFLDLGMRVRVLSCAPAGWDPIELNNPTDVAAIEAIFVARANRHGEQRC